MRCLPALREFVDLDLRADLPRLVVAEAMRVMAAAWQPLVAAELLVAQVWPPQFFLAASCPAVSLAALSPQAVFHP